MSEVLEFTITGKPLSGNARLILIRKGSRCALARTKEYKAQIKEITSIVDRAVKKNADWTIPVPMPKRESYLRIFVTWQRSTYRRADVDNAVKCLGDALQEALGVDDSKFEFTTDRRYGSTDLMEVQIVRRTAEKT
tara:strand:- start:419 stop:826 length:408 start_codon:yes stop_codon:yes gene_type:complete